MRLVRDGLSGAGHQAGAGEVSRAPIYSISLRLYHDFSPILRILKTYEKA
jgi:hypothetical protein